MKGDFTRVLFLGIPPVVALVSAVTTKKVQSANETFHFIKFAQTDSQSLGDKRKGKHYFP